MKYRCLEYFLIFLVINPGKPKKYLGNICVMRYITFTKLIDDGI